MSFATIARCSQDSAFVDRVTAATVQEAWNNTAAAGTDFGHNVQDSYANALRMAYPVATATDIEAAYASALAADNPDPGGDEAVITDGMILAQVQSMIAAPKTEANT